MSDKFNGFSLDDISKINKKTFKTMRPPELRRHRMLGKKELARSQENLKAKKPDQNDTNSAAITIPQHEDTRDDIDFNKSMSKSIEGALFYQQVSKSEDTYQDSLDKASIVNEQVAYNSTDESLILPAQVNSLDSPFKGVSLRDFENHRKIMKEQNKQKTEMLYKAIEVHSQKTAAEAKKIDNIKGELAKLDNDLATDVALLRKQIETACIHYANIEKVYNKIETQFLKAKFDLHNASEKKELLTEHLCTVIAHNEDRKAQKLSELMNKVGLTSSGHLNETNGLHNDPSI